MLTDEQIIAAIAPLYAERRVAQIALAASRDEYRAIEAAITEPLLQRIAELERKSDQDDETILWQAKEIADKIDRIAELEAANEAVAKRQNLWNLRMIELERQLEEMTADRDSWAQQASDLVDDAIDAAMQKG